MRVGALYAVLRLEKGQFEAALATSRGKFAAFASFVRASGLIAAQALAVIVGGSIAAAATFEQHMNQAIAIMGDVSDKVRAKMEAAARAVAKTSTFSANSAADAFYFLASAGFTAQQSIAALPTVAQFAQAGVMDLERATELLMDAQTTMGLRTKDASKNMENMARVSDVLSAAQIHSNATLEQMAEALTNKAGPALRVVGKDIEEGAAALMILANRGVKGRQAGTNLAIVLRELQTKAIKNKDAFKEMGVAVFDAEGNMRSLPAIVGDLEDALSGLTDEQKKEALLELGFTDRSVGVIQALLGTSKQMAHYERMLRKAGGTTQTVAEKQMDTLINQAKRLWHVVTDVGIALGQKMIPHIKDAVKAIADWIDQNEELIVGIVSGIMKGVGEFVDIILKLAGAVGSVLGPVLATLGDLLRPVLDYMAKNGVLMKAFGIAIAAVVVPALVGLLVALAPIAAIFAGIVAAVTIGTLVWEKWGKDISRIVGGVVKTVGGFIGNLMNLDTGPLAGLVPVFKTIAGAIGDVIGTIRVFIDALFHGNLANFDDGPLAGLANMIVAVADVIREVAPKIIDGVTQIASSIVEVVGTAFTFFVTSVLPLLAQGFTFLVEDVLPTVMDIFTMIAETVIPIFADAFNFLATDVIPAVAAAITWFTENVLPAIVAVMSGIISWVHENWPTISSIIKQVMGAIMTVMTVAWNIVSTVVKVAWNIIKGIISFVVPIIWGIIEPIASVLLPMIGFAAGILVKAIDGAFKLIGGIWQTAANVAGVIAATIGAAFSWLGLFFTGLWDGITSTFKGAINIVIGLVNGFLGFLNGIHIDIPAVDVGPVHIGGGVIDPFNIPTIPYLARGTRSFQGGLAVVGEQGPELVRLPSGAQVMSNPELMQMMSGGKKVERHAHIHISGNEPTVEKATDAVRLWERLEFLDD